jgi:hypothetical protein
VNTETDRVYVATKLGNIHCFSEIGTEFPVIHQVKEVLADEKPLVRGKSPTTAPESPVVPAEASPSDIDNFPGFGDEPANEPAADEGGDNPFDFGGATDSSAPEEQTPEADTDVDMGDDNPFDFGEN